MSKTTRTVLFLCTGNSARSILAEAILNHAEKARAQGSQAAPQFQGFSAGSRPLGQINPFALALLKAKGHDVSNLRSKSWDEFAAPGAPRLDFIFTVCDNAAAESCPHWPGHPMSAHWGLPDPAAVPGSDADKARAFARTYAQLSARIAAFRALDLDTMEPQALRHRLRQIGNGTVSSPASGNETN